MLAEIEKRGKLRVGITQIVPWAMHDKQGNLIGLSVDVARKLARDMGVEVEFHPVEFPYLISDLLADRYDIIISGFSIVADRALQINFSAPYYNTDVTLAANLKTAGGLENSAGVRQADPQDWSTPGNHSRGDDRQVAL